MIRMVFLNEDKRISMILDGKLTPAQMIRAFISSAKFMTKLPGNEGYIKILYRAYLNREADAERPVGLAGKTERWLCNTRPAFGRV